VEWLRQHGWCIDNIDIRPAVDAHMGRGAFARRPLNEGQVVAPAPLQVFADKKVFMDRKPEQLYVNYCFEVPYSNMLIFPYGQGVNLINHPPTHAKPNVYLRWSNHPLHHASWLDLDLDAFWKVAKPGGLILEVVALRDIAQGEELYLDYGPEWEDAWQRHVSSWTPPEGSHEYVYPAYMDETEPLRTIEEQKTNPYPSNLITMCSTPDWSSRRGHRNITWYDPQEWSWWEGLTYCHILERELNRKTGDFVYTVQLMFSGSHNPSKLTFDEKMPRSSMYIDEMVPRRAIRFVEKPYEDDEHLPGVFRHPIKLPEELVPGAWKTEL